VRKLLSGLGDFEMKKPKYLYHGSGKKLKTLSPLKPDDTDPVHNKKGVYTTSSKKDALGFCAIRSAKTNCFRCRNTGMMNVVEGWPDLTKTVYLHILDSKDFEHNKGTEWICPHKVKPIKIVEYKVSDLQHLWRKSSKREMKEYLKDRDAWRAPED